MAEKIDLTMSRHSMVATTRWPTLCCVLVVRLDGRINKLNIKIHLLLIRRENIRSVRSKERMGAKFESAPHKQKSQEISRNS